jgi:hypothetical protein
MQTKQRLRSVLMHLYMTMHKNMFKFLMFINVKFLLLTFQLEASVPEE